MPATAVRFGINRHAGSLIEEVSTEEKIEVAKLRGSKGATRWVKPYDPMTSGTVKGHGETDVAVGIGESGVSGITGGVTIITNFKFNEKNTEADGWEYSFEHYPDAEEIPD
mgnify:CR=1 FL=1